MEATTQYFGKRFFINRSQNLIAILNFYVRHLGVKITGPYCTCLVSFPPLLQLDIRGSHTEQICFSEDELVHWPFSPASLFSLIGSRARIFILLRSSRIDSKEAKNSARLSSLAGRYDNPIPTRFLIPMELFKNSSTVLFLGCVRFCQVLLGHETLCSPRTSVLKPEYTQSGNGRFLATFHK